MTVYKLKIKRNRIYRSAKLTILKLLPLFLIGILLTNCATYQNTSTTIPDRVVVSETTTNQTALTKKDVANYFCYNLTEYFNTYKYYKIFSEVYSEKEKQNSNSTTRITKRGNIYDVEYIGSAGRYVISFSNSNFPNSAEIFTFGRYTILGNAVRIKVYDTFTAWISKMEIALKANYNSYLFSREIDAAVEVEKWYNSLSVSGQ